MNLLLLIVLIAVLGALTIIGLVIYLVRKSTRNTPNLKKDLDAEEVDEITSTWNLLNH